KKDNKPFATMKIEDFTGMMEAMCWNDTYEKIKEYLVDGAVVEMRATCQKDERTEMNRLTGRDITPMKPRKARVRQEAPAETPSVDQELPPPAAQILWLKLDAGTHTVEDLENIRGILSQHPGEVPVQFEIKRRGSPPVCLAAGQQFRVSQTTDLVKALLPWLG
ncbi:MAG: polymerase alpha subunit, partial [Verrucomicrobiaceae bacterium]|nr:polymerase alpha subunit [Verrucomicrobiaceae bacterium]